MYRIIGADGLEYGPVDADVVRNWIRERRANADTRVRPEGAADWVRLETLGEFAADLKAEPSPGLPMDTRASFSVTACISRGWGLVRDNFWLTVGVGALMILMIWVASFVPVLGPLLLTMVLLGGYDWMFLKLLRGQSAELQDSFIGFGPLFVPLMLFSLVSQVLTTVGFILCIIPGIYLTVVWVLFPALLIIDKGLDFWPAMELSRKVAHKHFWPLLGLVCLCLLLAIAGVLALGIGFFVAWPIATAAVVCAYEDLFGTALPEVPPPGGQAEKGT